MSRRPALVATWLAGTAVAMLLVGFSTSLVQGRVSTYPQALPVVQRQDVTDQLSQARAEDATSTSAAPASQGSLPGGAPGEGPTQASGPASTAVPIGAPEQPGGTPRSPAPPPTTGRTGSGAVVTTSSIDDHGGERPPSPTSSAPATTTTTRPTTTTPTPTSQEEINAVGGWVLVRCVGDAVTLLNYGSTTSAWNLAVVNWGPSEIEVHFDLDDQESRIKARCRAGVIDGETRDA